MNAQRYSHAKMLEWSVSGESLTDTSIGKKSGLTVACSVCWFIICRTQVTVNFVTVIERHLCNSIHNLITLVENLGLWYLNWTFSDSANFIHPFKAYLSLKKIIYVINPVTNIYISFRYPFNKQAQTSTNQVSLLPNGAMPSAGTMTISSYAYFLRRLVACPWFRIILHRSDAIYFK